MVSPVIFQKLWQSLPYQNKAKSCLAWYPSYANFKAAVAQLSILGVSILWHTRLVSVEKLNKPTIPYNFSGVI